MTAAATISLSAHDKAIMQRLGARVAEIAGSAATAERRRLGNKLVHLEAERPLVMVHLGILAPPDVECEAPWLQRYEMELRHKLYLHDVVGDDTIFLPRIEHRGFTADTGFGARSVQHWGGGEPYQGSMVWEPALKHLPEDFSKLHFREFSFDWEQHQREQALLEEAFRGVLPVVDRGIWVQWTMGLTNSAVDLIGLERFLIGMYDEPESLHALMAFLRDDHLHMLDWFEQAGVLKPDDGDGVIAAGGCFYSDALPGPDYDPLQPARVRDLWGLAESQETVGVSPEMFEEFVFAYQLPIIRRFGLAGYGCCEPLDSRWQVIKQIPNLRRVSVSPWSDVHRMAEYIGREYIYSRKPNPSYVSTPQWEEEVIRQDFRDTLLATRGLNVEFTLKDVMTVCGEMWRLKRWVEIAREEIDRVYGG